jgi:hypothetical protein
MLDFDPTLLLEQLHEKPETLRHTQPDRTKSHQIAHQKVFPPQNISSHRSSAGSTIPRH